MYEVLFSKKAQKIYQNLSISIKTKIDLEIRKLERNPHPIGKKRMIHLKGNTLADYRCKIGLWRILYDIYEEDKKVFVIFLRKRNKNTYK